MLEQYHKLPVGTLFIFEDSDAEFITKLQRKIKKIEVNPNAKFYEQIAQFKLQLAGKEILTGELIRVKIPNPGFVVYEKLDNNRYRPGTKFVYNYKYQIIREHKLYHVGKPIVYDMLIPFRYVKLIINNNGSIKTTENL